MMEPFLSGAICLALLTIILFFTVAFTLLLTERLVRVGMDLHSEFLPVVYGIRLAAYGLILVGIVDKNRRN